MEGMSDYGGSIPVPQPLTSDDDSSDHSPLSQLPAVSTPRAVTRSASGEHPDNTPAVDYHHAITQPTPENTMKKPRGRPPGSKNKPKPPVVITREIESTMKPVILEISAGADIVDSIVTFARRNHASISVICASGSVANVTLRHLNSHGPLVSLRGPFNLLSLSGFFHDGGSGVNLGGCFAVTLAGTQGHVIGGVVGGKVMAASPVVVVGSTFVDPSYQRLPYDADRPDEGQRDQATGMANVGGGASGNEVCSGAGMSMPVYGVADHTPLSSQMPSNVNVMQWGPTLPPF